MHVFSTFLAFPELVAALQPVPLLAGAPPQPTPHKGGPTQPPPGMDPEVFWLASRPLAKPSPVPPKVQTYSSRYLSSTNGDLLSIVVCGNVTRPEGRGSSRVACGHNSYPARGARDFCRRALGIAAQPSSCRGSSRLGYCGADITLQLGRRSCTATSSGVKACRGSRCSKRVSNRFCEGEDNGLLLAGQRVCILGVLVGPLAELATHHEETVVQLKTGHVWLL